MFFIAIPLILAGVAFLGMHFPIQENPELYMDQYSIIFVEDGIKKSVNISDITYIKLYPGAHGKGYKGYRRSSYVALYDHETKILKIKYPSFQFLYDLKHYAPSAKFRLSSLFFDIICAVVTLLLCVFLCYIMVTDGKLFKDIFDNYRNSL